MCISARKSVGRVSKKEKGPSSYLSKLRESRMGGGASGGRGKRNGDQDLVLDLSCRHSRAGAAPKNWHRTGALLHPGKPDKDLDEKAARKIHANRELYRDHRRQLDFLSAIDSTSGRIHCELLRLLFLHAHRETARFFQILDDEEAPPNTARFTHRHAAFFIILKGKTGLMVDEMTCWFCQYLSKPRY